MSNVAEQLRKYGVTLTVTHEEHEEMTDIVERLRNTAGMPENERWRMEREAADEIERLRGIDVAMREEVVNLRAVLGDRVDEAQ